MTISYGLCWNIDPKKIIWPPRAHFGSESLKGLKTHNCRNITTSTHVKQVDCVVEQQANVSLFITSLTIGAKSSMIIRSTMFQPTLSKLAACFNYCFSGVDQLIGSTWTFWRRIFKHQMTTNLYKSNHILSYLSHCLLSAV